MPVIRVTIDKARSEAEILAAKVVGVDLRSQIAPTGRANQNRPGGKSAS